MRGAMRRNADAGTGRRGDAASCDDGETGRGGEGHPGEARA